MKRELRDELEVKGYVNMYESISKNEALKRCRDIMENASKRGITMLKDLNQDEKKEMMGYFNILGIKHDGNLD